MKYATVHRLTSEDGSGAGRRRVLSRLLEETWPGNEPEGLTAAAREAATWTEEGQHALGVAVTLYFLATIAATFESPGDDPGALFMHPDGMDQLARARASIAIDAHLADELISRYRQQQGWTEHPFRRLGTRHAGNRSGTRCA